MPKCSNFRRASTADGIAKLFWPLCKRSLCIQLQAHWYAKLLNDCIIETFMCPMIRVWHMNFNRLDQTVQFISGHNAGMQIILIIGYRYLNRDTESI